MVPRRRHHPRSATQFLEYFDTLTKTGTRADPNKEVEVDGKKFVFSEIGGEMAVVREILSNNKARIHLIAYKSDFDDVQARAKELGFHYYLRVGSLFPDVRIPKYLGKTKTPGGHWVFHHEFIDGYKPITIAQNAENIHSSLSKEQIARGEAIKHYIRAALASAGVWYDDYKWGVDKDGQIVILDPPLLTQTEFKDADRFTRNVLPTDYAKANGYSVVTTSLQSLGADLLKQRVDRGMPIIEVFVQSRGIFVSGTVTEIYALLNTNQTHSGFGITGITNIGTGFGFATSDELSKTVEQVDDLIEWADQKHIPVIQAQSIASISSPTTYVVDASGNHIPSITSQEVIKSIADDATKPRGPPEDLMRLVNDEIAAGRVDSEAVREAISKLSSDDPKKMQDGRPTKDGGAFSVMIGFDAAVTVAHVDAKGVLSVLRYDKKGELLPSSVSGFDIRNIDEEKPLALGGKFKSQPELTLIPHLGSLWKHANNATIKSLVRDYLIETQMHGIMFFGNGGSHFNRVITSTDRLKRIEEIIISRYLGKLGSGPLTNLLDVGVSSGVTTLDWIRRLDKAGVQGHMDAFELVLYLRLVQDGDNSAVFDPYGNVFQVRIGEAFYAVHHIDNIENSSDHSQAYSVLQAKYENGQYKEFSRIDPALDAYSKQNGKTSISVDLQQTDILKGGPEKSADVIRIFNVFRSKTRSEVIESMLQNAGAMLKEGGFLFAGTQSAIDDDLRYGVWTREGNTLKRIDTDEKNVSDFLYNAKLDKDHIFGDITLSTAKWNMLESHENPKVPKLTLSPDEIQKRVWTITEKKPFAYWKTGEVPPDGSYNIVIREDGSFVADPIKVRVGADFVGSDRQGIHDAMAKSKPVIFAGAVWLEGGKIATHKLPGADDVLGIKNQSGHYKPKFEVAIPQFLLFMKSLGITFPGSLVIEGVNKKGSLTKKATVAQLLALGNAEGIVEADGETDVILARPEEATTKISEIVNAAQRARCQTEGCASLAELVDFLLENPDSIQLPKTWTYSPDLAAFEAAHREQGHIVLYVEDASAVEDILETLGHGRKAIVVHHVDGKIWHAMNALNVKGEIEWLDASNGRYEAPSIGEDVKPVRLILTGIASPAVVGGDGLTDADLSEALEDFIDYGAIPDESDEDGVVEASERARERSVAILQGDRFVSDQLGPSKRLSDAILLSDRVEKILRERQANEDEVRIGSMIAGFLVLARERPLQGNQAIITFMDDTNAKFGYDVFSKHDKELAIGALTWAASSNRPPDDSHVVIRALSLAIDMLKQEGSLILEEVAQGPPRGLTIPQVGNVKPPRVPAKLLKTVEEDVVHGRNGSPALYDAIKAFLSTVDSQSQGLSPTHANALPGGGAASIISDLMRRLRLRGYETGSYTLSGILMMIPKVGFRNGYRLRFSVPTFTIPRAQSHFQRRVLASNQTSR